MLRRADPGRTLVALLTASLVVGLGFVGCGTNPSSLCDDICDCQGCTQSQRDDCADGFDDAQKEAESHACTDLYDDWLSCLGDELACRDGEVDIDGCESESEKLGACVGGTVVGAAGACKALVAECGGSDSGCRSDSADCASQCILDNTADHCDPANWSMSEAQNVTTCFSDCG